MVKCRFLYMRIISLSFLLLFNLSTHVMSCPSSGDGDCVPSKDTYNKGSNQSSTSGSIEKSSVNTSSSYESNNDDPGLPDDYIPKKTSYLKKINEKSKLNSKITKLNFDLDNIIYTSLKQYNSNFSEQINRKLYDINSLMVQEKNIDKNIFNSLHEKIDKLLNTITYSYDDSDDKYLKFKPHKKNKPDIPYQINKYNEINDIIKTLEVMN